MQWHPFVMNASANMSRLREWVMAWMRERVALARSLVVLLVLLIVHAVVGDPAIVFGPSLALGFYAYYMFETGRNHDFAEHGFQWLLYALIGACALWAVWWVLGLQGIVDAFSFNQVAAGVGFVVALASLGLSLVAIFVAGLVMKKRHPRRIG